MSHDVLCGKIVTLTFAIDLKLATFPLQSEMTIQYLEQIVQPHRGNVEYMITAAVAKASLTCGWHGEGV